MGDFFFIERPFYLLPEIFKQLHGGREIVRAALVLCGAMPVVIGCALLPVASAWRLNGVRIIKPHPGRAAALRTQYEGIADPVRALRRWVGAPDRELDNDPNGHLEISAIQGKQRLKLAYIHIQHNTLSYDYQGPGSQFGVFGR